MRTKKRERLPKKLYPYFWEIDQKKLDVAKREHYILTRLLEYGDQDAIRWAWRNFGKQAWQEALRSRDVSKRTRLFWESLVRARSRTNTHARN